MAIATIGANAQGAVRDTDVDVTDGGSVGVGTDAESIDRSTGVGVVGTEVVAVEGSTGVDVVVTDVGGVNDSDGVGDTVQRLRVEVVGVAGVDLEGAEGQPTDVGADVGNGGGEKGALASAERGAGAGCVVARTVPLARWKLGRWRLCRREVAARRTVAPAPGLVADLATGGTAPPLGRAGTAGSGRLPPALREAPETLDALDPVEALDPVDALDALSRVDAPAAPGLAEVVTAVAVAGAVVVGAADRALATVPLGTGTGRDR